MTRRWRSTGCVALLGLISCTTDPERALPAADLPAAEVACVESEVRTGLDHIMSALRQGEQLGPFITEAVYGNPAGVIFFEIPATGKEEAEDLTIANFPDLTITMLTFGIDIENDIGNFEAEWVDPDGRKATGKGALKCSQKAFAAIAVNWLDLALELN